MLPFAMLSMATAVLGSFLVSGLVTGSMEERFTNQLLESSRATNDAFARQEQRHLGLLRTVIFTSGVSAAAAAGDATTLRVLLDPIAANEAIPRVEVLDAAGRTLYARTENPSRGGYLDIPDADTASAEWSIVSDALAGRVDDRGDKWAQFAETASGAALFTAAPILDGSRVLGVVVVGTPINQVLWSAREQALAYVSAYDPSGRPLGSTFGLSVAELSTLRPLEPIDVLSPALVREHRDVLGRGYDIVYAPLVVRGDVIGVQSVALSTDYVVAAASTARTRMAAFFGVLTLSVLTIGWLLARHLTVPLLRLVGAARALAGGDFSARSDVHTQDEIGVLAVTFDAMAERLQRQHLATIGALASAIDARDPYTAGHSLRVGELAAALGRDMGLPSSSIQHLQVGGILHDIGKIGIRDSVLLKRGSLTVDERILIEEHPRIGLRILGPAGLPGEVLDIVGAHHERLDGTGYPLRLTSDELSIFPRIAAVADVFDALTTHRPYRPAIPVEDALRLLEREAAEGALDPDVINSMRRLAVDWASQTHGLSPFSRRTRIDRVQTVA